MSEFLIYFELGFKHILNVYSYDHILFLIALSVPFTFKDWKRILLLVTIFMLGHSLSLILVVFEIVAFKVSVVELLIPVTIICTAFFNLFTAGKTSKKESVNLIFFFTLFFGVIHGLGFSSYFKSILPGGTASKILPLCEFSIGVEAGQLVVVFVMLIISYIVQTFFIFNKRDWALVMSAFIIGVILPLIIANEIWLK